MDCSAERQKNYCITTTNAFQNFLDECNCKPNKYG